MLDWLQERIFGGISLKKPVLSLLFHIITEPLRCGCSVWPRNSHYFRFSLVIFHISLCCNCYHELETYGNFPRDGDTTLSVQQTHTIQMVLDENSKKNLNYKQTLNINVEIFMHRKLVAKSL